MPTKKKAESKTVAPQPAGQGQKPAASPATQSRTAGYTPATGSTMTAARSQAQSRTASPQPAAQGQQPAASPATQTRGYVPATGSTMNPQPQPGRGDGSHVANQQAHNPYENSAPRAYSSAGDPTGGGGRIVTKAGSRPVTSQNPNAGDPGWGSRTSQMPQPAPVTNVMGANRPPDGYMPAETHPGYADLLNVRTKAGAIPTEPKLVYAPDLGALSTVDTGYGSVWTRPAFEDWRAGERGDPGAWQGNPQPAKVDTRDTLKHRGNIVNGVPGVEVVGVNDTAITAPDSYVDPNAGMTDYWPTGDANGNGQWDPWEQWGRGGGYSRPWYDYQQQVEDWFPGMMNWRF